MHENLSDLSNSSALLCPEIAQVNLPSAFDDRPVIDDDDAVGVSDGGQPMRHDQRRAIRANRR